MHLRIALVFVLLVSSASVAIAQTSRDATRERVHQVLGVAGPRSDVNVSFRQSDKQPYNFIGHMSVGSVAGLDDLEIVISVTASQTIGFRIYPRYNGRYINLERARDITGLMRKLLQFNDTNFMFWGADNVNDVFAGYSITLESGVPEEAIVTVLRSIALQPTFIEQLRPFID